jgi:hypothetical protein
VFNAIKGGDLGLAAEIAMTGVQLAVATIMESVLGLFGTSIDGMLQMFNDFVSKVAAYTKALITITKTSFNALTGGAFQAQVEQLATVANALTDLGEVGLNTTLTALGASFDVDGLRDRLDRLNETAAAAAEDAQSGGSGLDFDSILGSLSDSIVTGLQQASNLSSVGTFSGQQVAMMGFASEDYQLRTAVAAERLNQQMEDLKRKEPRVT